MNSSEKGSGKISIELTYDQEDDIVLHVLKQQYKYAPEDGSIKKHLRKVIKYNMSPSQYEEWDEGEGDT